MHRSRLTKGFYNALMILSNAFGSLKSGTLQHQHPAKRPVPKDSFFTTVPVSLSCFPLCTPIASHTNFLSLTNLSHIYPTRKVWETDPGGWAAAQSPCHETDSKTQLLEYPCLICLLQMSNLWLSLYSKHFMHAPVSVLKGYKSLRLQSQSYSHWAHADLPAAPASTDFQQFPCPKGASGLSFVKGESASPGKCARHTCAANIWIVRNNKTGGKQACSKLDSGFDQNSLKQFTTCSLESGLAACGLTRTRPNAFAAYHQENKYVIVNMHLLNLHLWRAWCLVLFTIDCNKKNTVMHMPPWFHEASFQDLVQPRSPVRGGAFRIASWGRLVRWDRLNARG